jgi:hypothetical protein
MKSQKIEKHLAEKKNFGGIFFSSATESAKAQLLCRVARFFLVHDSKTGKNVPNAHKIYQTAIKYPKSP